MNEDQNSHRTVLLVDDYADTRRLLALHLRQRGYRVVEAENGAEAVEAARGTRPDLVLMDLSMPGLDGLSATCRMREREEMRDVPFVALSAHGADTHREAAAAVGCDEYLTKPVAHQQLEEVVARLLDSGRPHGRREESRIKSETMDADQLLETVERLITPEH